jgi:DNA polymerase III alpha subunit
MFWRYGNMEEIVQQLHSHFKENFMLEIQYHNTPAQINLNRKIKQLSQKYGIKMIMGCDSHFIYPEQEEDRNIILEAKNIRYEEEEGWYLDYPDGETAFQRLKDQGIFTDEEILAMMNNTNILLEFDDIEFDKEIKLPSLFPHLSQEEKDK